MRIYLKHALSATVLVLLLAAPALTQVTANTLAERAKTPSNSIPLKATAAVSDCISVEAVLLPKKPTAMLFSGYVAENFAVVKTTISNHCSDQQFILHNIYFDYSDWALSGVYSAPKPCSTASSSPSEAPPATQPQGQSSGTGAKSAQQDATQQTQSVPGTARPNTASGCDPNVKSTNPGQVATVGALDVQEEVTEDSVFSKRNLVVNGLTLIGQIAGGYAFVGSTAASQGIGAYNSAFVPNFAKFWPDRRIDQEKFLLALGYRTDQTTVIAKQDHGSYYAFFPIATFLTPPLKKLFLEDPAVFLNPAETFFDPGALVQGGTPTRKADEAANLRSVLLKLAGTIEPDVTWNELLVHLSGKCDDEKDCQVCMGKDAACPQYVLAEKNLFDKASLNAARIVVRGVMTIEVNSIPPTIDEVKFDNEDEGQTLWEVSPAKADANAAPATAQPAATRNTQAMAAKQGGGAGGGTSTASSTSVRTGIITGKFLSGGTPEIVAISVPGVENATQTDYVASNSLKAVSEKSSDTSMPFSLTLGNKTMPSGTKLTFQVSRTAPTTNADQTTGSATSSTKLVSNKYVYTVAYGSNSTGPVISGITIQSSGAEVWQTIGKVDGTLHGTNLAGGSISIASIEVNGTTAPTSDYIASIAEVPKTSNATSLDFQLSLAKAIPVGTKISFVVLTKQDSTSSASQPYAYVVPGSQPTAQASGPRKSKASTKKAASSQSH